MALSTARADWHFDAETGAFYNSNLSRSDRAADEQNDWAWKSDVRAGYGMQLSRDLRLNLAGDVGGEVWDRFDAFNNVDLGASVGLRYRFGLGRQAPWIVAEDRLAHEFFNEDVRNGWANDFRIRGGVAITDRLSIEAGYLFNHFAARDNFFDLEGHGGSIRLTFDVTSSLQIALGYAYRYGDVISYAVPPRPDILAISIEREGVTSFGNPPYTAYRLQASTNAFSVSAGYTVTRNISVQVSYEYANTSHDSLKYENHLVEANIAFAY
jgi:opacity protein-like surface antigen